MRRTAFGDFYGMAMLAMEAQQVVWLRLMRLAAGGPMAESEARQMVSEKLSAAAEAGQTLALGGSARSVVRSYRRKVRANRRRLLK